VQVENAPGGSPALVLLNPAKRAYKLLFLFTNESDKQYVSVPYVSHGHCIAERNDGVKMEAEVALSAAAPLTPQPTQRAEQE